MSKSLIIVESPAKARTLKKFLSSRYQVLASVGHVRDLPKSRLGVDVENGFAPSYVTIKGKGEVIKELRAAAKKATHVYLATDPDREGEAIAWHLAELLKLQDRRRIELHEITKRATEEALKAAGDINIDRVNAQQARRILDRLVGYQISPLLWRKVRGGLSAGRVQSVAVKLIVDREREIEAFQRQQYWSVAARLWPQGHHDPQHTFIADLVSVDGRKLEKLEIATEPDATSLVERLEKARFAVKSVKKREVRRNPAPPFTTSTLQQEASRRLKMRVRRTMQLAQRLFEGVDAGAEGTVGLITYMRTDSTRVSGAAQAMARDFIVDTYGDDYHSGKQFKVADSAQDAHEAIRPTEVRRTPASLAKVLEPAQLKVYRLIWERFAASQMAAAIYDQTTVDVEAAGCGLRATGSVLKFPGYTAIYEETRDEDATEEDERKKHLPAVEDGQALDAREVLKERHETEPPPRFTEATLVKTLEERGIGRPSTYAAIVETVQARGYVKLTDRRFCPEDIGYIVTDMLEEHFPEIVNENFTSQMESRLDKVEEDHADWVAVLRDFYGPFSEELKRAEANFPKVEMEEEETSEVCTVCGRAMRVKTGRFGKFLACSGYPECKTTKPIVKEAGVLCPRDGGRVLQRRSKRGRTFYGCENYPACDFAAWDAPVVGSACTICGAFLVSKQGRGGARLLCSRDGSHAGAGENSGIDDAEEFERPEKRSA
ncbi:MAG: type I DNA topoisomerase [Candidatus Eremiobacteraeota bacterium]|nr:type I DNA topoisomerase [Candidatus Eremiobacteraeota bacterium]MBC5826137.1 type I DNA topoisomerase [Candidatus Eremiobacteraeota bacterium]